MNYYFDVLKKYAVFEGRARRKEYWFFALFNIIASALVGILAGVIAGISGVPELAMLSLVYALGIIIPSIAVTVRRLHDTGRSGWWMLIVLIPFVGAIAFLAFLVFDSEEAENKYGPNPKAE